LANLKRKELYQNIYQDKQKHIASLTSDELARCEIQLPNHMNRDIFVCQSMRNFN